MAEAKKRERNFERSYSDDTGVVEISHNDDTVLSVSVVPVEAKPAEGDTPAVEAQPGISPEVLKKAGMRYITDILVGQGNAALRAEGGTAETAQAKMLEMLKSLQDGTFKFRAASGDGGLSVEEEKKIIAGVLVTLGKAATEAEGLTKVEAVYSRTSTNAKGYVVRKDYNQLKAVPQVKVALANASKAETNLDDLLKV